MSVNVSPECAKSSAQSMKIWAFFPFGLMLLLLLASISSGALWIWTDWYGIIYNLVIILGLVAATFALFKSLLSKC